MDVITKRRRTLKCGPRLHYSVDLRIQTYTVLVPLKFGKHAPRNIRGYTDFFYSVWNCNVHTPDTQKVWGSETLRQQILDSSSLDVTANKEQIDRYAQLFILTSNYQTQEAFEKCWAHSPLRAAARPFTRCRYRYCRTPPAHRCPRQQRQRVTEGTALAPWNGPKKFLCYSVSEK